MTHQDTQISVHRALTLIKKTMSDLPSLARNSVFISTTIGNKKQPTDRSFLNEEELKKRIQSDTDSFNSKLDLVVSLKKAVAEANLKTIVSFNGREYTVTELLAIKETMAIRDTFLLQLRHQMQLANSQSSEAVTKIQTLAKDSPIENLQETLNTFTNLYGVNIISADSKLSPAEYVAKQITEQESLKNELDLVLSESNIKTMISI